MLRVRMHVDCALFRAGKCACMRGNVDKQAALKRIAKLDLELQIAVMEAQVRESLRAEEELRHLLPFAAGALSMCCHLEIPRAHARALL